MAEINVPNYPGNPKKTKPPTEKEKPKPLVEGAVLRRKKSIGKRLKDAFIGEDVSFKDYIFQEVVIPGIKGFLSDISYGVSDCIETALFGRSRGGGNRSYKSNRGSYTGYGTFYQSSSTPAPKRSSERLRTRSRGSFDDVILNSRKECEDILFALADLIEQYGFAKVSDLNDMLKEPGSFTDEYYGWDNMEELSAVKPYRDRDGFILSLPNPVKLER